MPSGSCPRSRATTAGGCRRRGRRALRRLSVRYRELTSRMPDIPNVLFNPLKAAHLRKVETIRIRSERPGLSACKARRALRNRPRLTPSGSPGERRPGGPA